MPCRTSSRATPSTSHSQISWTYTFLCVDSPRSISSAKAAVNRSETEMVSINGTAMQNTLRDLNRAAVGTELDR
jgi:hypothetical protein